MRTPTTLPPGIYTRPGSPYYWADWYHPVERKRYRESTKVKTTDKATKAVRFRERRIARAERGEAGSTTAGRKLALGAMLDRVVQHMELQRRRSVARVRIDIQWLVRGLGGPNVRVLGVTADRLVEYVRWRQGQGIADGTIVHELAVLKRAYRLAIRAKLVPTDAVPAFPEIELHNTRQGFVNDADLGLLMLELPPYLRAPTRWAYVTGWRAMEVFSARWSWVDRAEETVTLPPSFTDTRGNDDRNKTRRKRVVPYGAHPALVALLAAQWAEADRIERETGHRPEWVFPYPDGRGIRYYSGAWRTATRRAGLAGVLFHDLRRSAVRNLNRAGVSQAQAMSITGHKTTSVYHRYGIVDEAAQREALAKLAQAPEEAPSPDPV